MLSRLRAQRDEESAFGLYLCCCFDGSSNLISQKYGCQRSFIFLFKESKVWDACALPEESCC